jgi:hypothetical protein
MKFLARLENADPNVPDLSEDDSNAGWGHYQFTAGGLTISSALVSLKSVGNSETVCKLFAAALKTCIVARHICFERGLDPSSFISDTYLQILAEKLWDLWKEAGGVCVPCSDCLFSFLDLDSLLRREKANKKTTTARLLLMTYPITPETHQTYQDDHPTQLPLLPLQRRPSYQRPRHRHHWHYRRPTQPFLTQPLSLPLLPSSRSALLKVPSTLPLLIPGNSFR